MDTGLTEGASKFIERHIRSMSGLEALLYMREHANSEYTAENLANSLRGNIDWISDLMNFYKTHGLIAEVSTGVYRYRPENASEEAIMVELARVFRQRPSTLLSAILAAPSQNIQSFADAFRLKGS